MRSLALIPALVVAAALVMVTPVVGAAQVTVVASGLDSPRGVALSRGDALVAEAGHGGDVCIPNAIFGTNCMGMTSQISEVNLRTGAHRPVVSGLFSSLLGGSESLGVSGIDVRNNKILAIVGQYPQEVDSLNCAGMPADCATVKAGAQAQAGQLLSVERNGRFKALAGVGAFGFDFTAEIPNQEHDANPYGVMASGDDVTLVADAGANTLNQVTDDGTVSVLHYFHLEPPAGAFPTDAVPTCVVRAGGKLWVADLSGRLFSIQGGAATQVPVVDSGGNRLIFHVTNCNTAGDDNRGRNDRDNGVIYLVNMWTTPTFPSPGTGSIVRYEVATGRASVVAHDLNFPNMLAVGSDQSLYVSANSVCPAGGGPDECNFMGFSSGLLLKITQ
jgi:hypothetical protein